jgi:hypothetical protein
MSQKRRACTIRGHDVCRLFVRSDGFDGSVLNGTLRGRAMLETWSRNIAAGDVAMRVFEISPIREQAGAD